ncbi:Os06g0238600 [Oryza sativa Japonica Group]|uniref:Uncharacterized protein n=2 Tax=Oryza sativa subsp. japonica TaxID=39947 RepID=Q67VF3_ORYSJ|nr:hypothetical protein EE612_032986 [Oryza sativa]BAD37866.1 hypothetical protein [Oryza sativa Japonica Group]BAD37903.1 hypothetical protein [Oryza sativa Japonica Group]BAS96978.1 Os06g0238600 [Oryza sativa Japonica Group]
MVLAWLTEQARHGEVKSALAEGRIVVAGTRPNSATADPAVAASQLAFTSVSAAIMIVREIAPEHQWAFPVRIMRGKGVTAERSMHISVCKLKYLLKNFIPRGFF